MGASDSLIPAGPGFALEPMASRFAKVLQRHSAQPHRSNIFVSFSLADRPGIVQAVTEFFAAGVKLDDRDPIRFNIESSLWSSHRGIGTGSFVLEPSIAADRASEYALLSLLRDSLSVCLAELVVHADDLYFGPFVEPITLGDELNLFASRRYAECRFGVMTLDEVKGSMVEALRLFTQRLKDRGVPLTFVYYPTDWTDHRPPGWVAEDDRTEDAFRNAYWMRIGFAPAIDSHEWVDIHIEAAQVASECGVGLAFYDPDFVESLGSDAQDSLLAHQFVHALPPFEGVSHEHHLEAIGERSGILVLAKAEVGLVHGIIGAVHSCGDVSLSGVSMSVLYGNTVILLVVTSSAREAVRAAIEKEVAGARTFMSGPIEHGGDGRRSGVSEILWVAWVSGDTAGVMSSLLGTLHTELQLNGIDGANITYEVSRVLEIGHACAGKVKVMVPRAMAEAVWGQGPIEGSAFGSHLESKLSRHLIPLKDTDGSVDQVVPETWKRRPVMVTRGEPGVEPWATLSLLASGDFSG